MSRQELYHYGILGMRWGIRRFQDYGEGGYNPKRKGLFKGKRARMQQAYTNNAKGAGRGKRSELTDEQKDKLKKAAIVGAAVAGTALATYGTVKVGSYAMGASQGKQIVESIIGGSATKSSAVHVQDMIEKLPKGNVGSNKTFSEICTTVNKNGGDKNCGPVSAAMIAKVNHGKDLIPKNTSETTWDVWEKAFNGAKHSTVNPIEVENHKGLSSYLSKKFKDGDNGILGLYSSNSAQHDSHFITFSKEKGKMVFRDGQTEFAPGIKGVEFDSNGNVSLGGHLLPKPAGKKFVEKYFEVYNMEITGYMQTNGHDFTNDIRFLKQFFE